MNKKFEKKLGKSKEAIVKIERVNFHNLNLKIERQLEQQSKKKEKKKKNVKKKHFVLLLKTLRLKYQLQKIQMKKVIILPL